MPVLLQMRASAAAAHIRWCVLELLGAHGSLATGLQKGIRIMAKHKLKYVSQRIWSIVTKSAGPHDGEMRAEVVILWKMVDTILAARCPTKKPVDMTEEEWKGFQKGWQACIDKGTETKAHMYTKDWVDPDPSSVRFEDVDEWKDKPQSREDLEPK